MEGRPAGIRQSVEFSPEGVPQWVDRRFPAFFVALGVVAAIGVASSPGDGPVAVAVALVLLGVAPWAASLVDCRVPEPVLVPLVLTPLGVLITAGGPLGIVDFDYGAPQLTMMLLVGLLGQVATVSRAWLIITTAVASYAIVFTGALVHGHIFDWMPWFVGLALAIGGGLAFRANLRHLYELELAQEALAAQAVGEERRRIAREVHDVVAHTMSVTMLHLTAARMAIARDPQAAVEALEEAERHGRASMEDIRQTVRLLRAADDAIAPSLPGGVDIATLVDGYRNAGTEVELEVDDAAALDVLPGSRQLAVYRLVQESLSNAVRHGDGGPVRVRIGRDASLVCVEVANTMDPEAPENPGSGIAGMRERVDALGGRLSAGAAPGRAIWLVRADIPAGSPT
jgi:signal transduction histidine kinase